MVYNISFDHSLRKHTSMPSSFVTNSRYVLLTYPQCGELDGFAVMDMLSALEAECIVAREQHADGNNHIHAFVDFGRTFRSRRSDIFDVGGCHPNISPSRGRPGDGYDYATKDGDIICGGLERPDNSGKKSEGKQAVYREIVDAESEDEFWQLVRELDPRALCLNYPSLRKYADNRYKRTVAEYEHPTCVSVDDGAIPELRQWRTDNLPDDTQSISGR